MKTYIILFTVLVCAGFKTSFAQSHCTDCLTPKDSTVTSSWVIGLGVNIVDDSATPFGWDFIRIADSWNMVPYPSRISVGKFLKNGIGIEGIGTYNRYKPGKLVDGQINQELRKYYAIDGKISYDLNKLVGETAWFDPYIHAGAGYSSIGGLGRMTANTGFGFNTWFNDKWGLNFNTMGKWGIKEGATKQLQHSAGVVRRLGEEKSLTKKGALKLALIEEMDKEMQRVSDSLDVARKLEEDKLAMAEKIAREKEMEKLAADEKARLEAERNRKNKIENAIKDIGKVYFALNSSYLNKNSKDVLDKIAVFMKDNPSLRINVASHTDARGTDDYNKWLSNRRASRTTEYLITKGISVDRLQAKGLGEAELTNHCKDGTHCTEKEHRANRRSEFNLLD